MKSLPSPESDRLLMCETGAEKRYFFIYRASWRDPERSELYLFMNKFTRSITSQNNIMYYAYLSVRLLRSAHIDAIGQLRFWKLFNFENRHGTRKICNVTVISSDGRNQMFRNRIVPCANSKRAVGVATPPLALSKCVSLISCILY